MCFSRVLLVGSRFRARRSRAGACKHKTLKDHLHPKIIAVVCFCFEMRCIVQTRDLIGCTNSSGSCRFPLRLVLEGKFFRDRLLLSHSTPAQINWGGGGVHK